MRMALFAILACWSAVGMAQTMYKCLDVRQRVTYSSEPCEKLGLKDAGPVVDRTTTMPLGPTPGSIKPAAPKPPAAKDDIEAVQRGSQIKPVVPLLEKLAK
jgi:hypothetical protein